MTADRRPIADPPPRLRQRRRKDGSWRIWWEPETAVRGMGFAIEELDARRLTWSTRRAQDLNAQVARAIAAPASSSRPTETHRECFSHTRLRTEDWWP